MQNKRIIIFTGFQANDPKKSAIEANMKENHDSQHVRLTFFHANHNPEHVIPSARGQSKQTPIFVFFDPSCPSDIVSARTNALKKGLADYRVTFETLGRKVKMAEKVAA